MSEASRRAALKRIRDVLAAATVDLTPEDYVAVLEEVEDDVHASLAAAKAASRG